MEHDQVPTGPVEGPAPERPRVSDRCDRSTTQARMPAGCPVCGLALPRPGRCPNRWCRRADRGFSVVFAVGVHEGALRHAILRYKYRREMWWADVFARLFANHLRSHATWFEEFDLLVPMPAYVGPHARRDWDPVGEIVARLGGLVAPALGDRGRRGRQAGRKRRPCRVAPGPTARRSPPGPSGGRWWCRRRAGWPAPGSWSSTTS